VGTENRYRYDMSIEEAAELARRSIYHATFRDGASGGVASGTLSLSLSACACAQMLMILI
jgi:20S proteasome alpha/beta subunit